ncbi:hypothetical protein PG994_007759 [Apiospora phragmitis]|uniref:Uncharacterized protein n=1 Tax=Apiospora phragmitis TaxID=2905665 RepID=A0ABR1UR49_9PEZI
MTINPSQSDNSKPKNRRIARKQDKATPRAANSSTQCQLPVSPPPSPEVPFLADLQSAIDEITPALLRDYMMSGNNYPDCFLGEEVKNMIIDEYKAAESQQSEMEQPSMEGRLAMGVLTGSQ